MRGLTIILTEAMPERFRTALMMAMTHQALGGRARLFLQYEAVTLLRPPIDAPGDTAHAATGLPSLAEIVEEAFATGIEIVVCQTGLHLTGCHAGEFDSRCHFGGLASVMADLGEDRLLAL